MSAPADRESHHNQVFRLGDEVSGRLARRNLITASRPTSSARRSTVAHQPNAVGDRPTRATPGRHSPESVFGPGPLALKTSTELPPQRGRARIGRQQVPVVVRRDHSVTMVRGTARGRSGSSCTQERRQWWLTSAERFGPVFTMAGGGRGGSSVAGVTSSDSSSSSRRSAALGAVRSLPRR